MAFWGPGNGIAIGSLAKVGPSSGAACACGLGRYRRPDAR